MVYVGKCCRMVRSMFVICWINDPSLPETPGGASRTREWSLHGCRSDEDDMGVVVVG